MNKIQLEDITIRTELKPGDIGYVTYMHGSLYGREYNFGISFEAYVAKGLYEFYARYDELLDRVWVAEHEGKIVGFLLLMHREPGEAQLRYFILDPAYRGMGFRLSTEIASESFGKPLKEQRYDLSLTPDL